MGYVASEGMSRSYCPAVSSTVMLLMVTAEINAGNVYIISLTERNLEKQMDRMLRNVFLHLYISLFFPN